MKIYVNNEYGKIVGVVTYNNILDNDETYPDYHRGITKLSTGEYVLIDRSEEATKAYTVSDETAFQAILESHHEEMLTVPKFVSLRRFCEDLAREI